MCCKERRGTALSLGLERDDFRPEVQAAPELMDCFVASLLAMTMATA
jgi:hypothetical protein